MIVNVLFIVSDEDEVAKLLLDAKADVNSKNGKGATPLIIAAVKGHHSVLRILASHSDIKLHEQVCDNNTYLFTVYNCFIIFAAL